MQHHFEVYRVNEMRYRRQLTKLFYQESGEQAPGSQGMQDAIAVLQAKAFFDGPELPVYVRSAEVDGVLYLDLGNDDWQVVRVSAGGWEVISEAPVHFRRPRGMLALPTPVTGGTLKLLKQFVPTQTDEDWILLASWLIMALRARGPFPVLVLFGSRGAGKSWLSLMLRNLVDPNKAAVRNLPREERDLTLAAENGHVVALDNISRLSEWLSDAICRLSTGSGSGGRQYYTDDEERLTQSCCPVVLNGIEEFAQRGDLVDRSLIIQFHQIATKDRLMESDLTAAFEAAHGAILGVLLDLVAAGLQFADSVDLRGRLPRMADFAAWSYAFANSDACEWTGEQFLTAYNDNRGRADAASVDASLVGKEVMRFMEGRTTEWKGTATDLLAKLNQQVDEQVKRQREWPKKALNLGSDLRRVSPSLRALGIDCVFAHGNDRTITLAPIKTD